MDANGRWELPLSAATATDTVNQITNFPRVCLAWERLEDLLHTITGWRTIYSSAMREFDEVSPVVA